MGLYLAISVGPILFTVINQSLNDGTRGGFSFVAGLWLSDILFVLLSNVFTGFTAHFLEVYIKEIGYGGGLLLFGLGCYYAFFKRAVVVPSAVAIKIGISHSKIATLFAKGFIINTVNPILFIEWLTAATVFALVFIEALPDRSYLRNFDRAGLVPFRQLVLHVMVFETSNLYCYRMWNVTALNFCDQSRISVFQ